MTAREYYTVAEVMGYAKVGESTIDRMIKKGTLKLVSGPRTRPRRLTAESVREYLEGRLDEKGPQLPPGVSGDRDSAVAQPQPVEDGDSAALRKRIGELEEEIRDSKVTVKQLQEENEQLRNDFQGLKLAHEIILDRLGAHDLPKLPNN